MNECITVKERGLLETNLRRRVVDRLCRQLLLLDLVRFAVAAARYLYYGRLRRGLRTYDQASGAVSADTIFHNLKSMRDLAVVRSLYLIRPLSTIERLSRASTVLSIGPRTEGELLSLVAHGFRKRNVTGLDLISYSPWVRLGDMHEMPFDDNSFDVVVLGWVLAYSDNKQKAIDEVVRVTKPGGVIAIGIEYSDITNEEFKEQVGYFVGSKERLTCVDHILSLVGDRVGEVFYRQDPPANEIGTIKRATISTIFSLKK